MPDVDFSDLSGYVGVSAGSFVAAALANGMTPRQLCAAFIENNARSEDLVQPSVFMRPAVGELARRVAALPGLTLQAAYRYAFKGDSLLSALERLGRALPTGVFSHAALEAQVRRLLTVPGRSNDFRRLGHRLVLVATDLDRGSSAPFGLPGWDHVPISQAVAASAALPGLFPPVAVDGRWYVDGALKKTLHATVLLDMGLDLVLCLNPLVPFDASHPARHRVLAGGEEVIPRLIDGGLPVVLSQTFRTLIHSRLELGMKGYDTSHPGMCCCSNPITATRRCSWPIPSAIRSAAGWPNMPTSVRAPTCARAAACCRPGYAATGWRWTTPYSTIPSARCSATAAPCAAAWRARCVGWTKCWTTWSRRCRRSRRGWIVSPGSALPGAP